MVWLIPLQQLPAMSDVTPLLPIADTSDDEPCRQVLDETTRRQQEVLEYLMVKRWNEEDRAEEERAKRQRLDEEATKRRLEKEEHDKRVAGLAETARREAEYQAMRREDEIEIKRQAEWDADVEWLMSL